MKKAMLVWALPLTLLTLLFGLLARRVPAQESAPQFSVTVLCEQEGNALLLRCGGQTLAVAAGTAEDAARLARYLRETGQTRIDLLCAAADAEIPAVLRERIELGQCLTPDAWNGVPLSVGAAECRAALTQEGELCLSVDCGGTTAELLRGGDDGAIRLRTGQGTERIDASDCSVRILCGEDGAEVLPELSAGMD